MFSVHENWCLACRRPELSCVAHVVVRRPSLSEQVATVSAECAREPARAADQSQFTLFNPTPQELVREMNTERRDTTEPLHG